MWIWTIGSGTIAAVIFCYLARISIKDRGFPTAIIVFSFLTSLFTFTVVLFRGHETSDAERLFITVSNLVKYGVVSLIAAIALPVLAVVIIKVARYLK